MPDGTAASGDPGVAVNRRGTAAEDIAGDVYDVDDIHVAVAVGVAAGEGEWDWFRAAFENVVDNINGVGHVYGGVTIGVPRRAFDVFDLGGDKLMLGSGVGDVRIYGLAAELSSATVLRQVPVYFSSCIRLPG